MSMEPSVSLLAEFEATPSALEELEWLWDNAPLYVSINHSTEVPTTANYLCLYIFYGYQCLTLDEFNKKLERAKLFIKDFCQQHSINDYTLSIVADFN